MKQIVPFALIALLGACSSGDDQAEAEKGKADPIVEQAQSLEKAADASVAIIEKEAQERVDAAQAEHQAVKAEAETQPADKGKKE